MPRLPVLLLVLLLAPLPASGMLVNGGLTLVGAINHCTSAVGTDAYACSLSPVPTTPAYSVNTLYSFTADVPNTDDATINLNGLGAVPLRKLRGGVSHEMLTNEIRAGMRVYVVFDGSAMQCLNCLGNDLAVMQGLLSDRPATCKLAQYYDAVDGPTGCQLSRCNEQEDAWEAVGNCGGGQTITGISSDGEGITGLKYSSLTVSTDTTLGQARSVCAETGTAGITLTLPPVADAPVSEYMIVICDNSTGILTLEPDGTDLINNVNVPFTMTGQGSQMDVSLIGGKWQLVSTAAASAGTSGSTGHVHLHPKSVSFPSTNAAVLDTSQAFPKLIFDNVVSQCVWWTFILPQDYVGSLSFQYVYRMPTLTIGSHFMDVSVMQTASNTADPMIDSFDTANPCNDSAVPAGTRHSQTIACALPNNDSMTFGKLTRLKLCRNVSDTVAEPSEVLGGLITYGN